MSETTQIHPDTVRAFRAPVYRIGHSAQDIVLHIDQHSERLARLFADSGVSCGAFLTAFNPRSTTVGSDGSMFTQMGSFSSDGSTRMSSMATGKGVLFNESSDEHRKSVRLDDSSW